MIFKADWEKTDTLHKLPAGMIEKMVHCAYPSKILQSYNLIAGGCANLNFQIRLQENKNQFILRVYLRDKESVYKEQRLYTLLKDTVPVPQIYFIGEIDNYQFAITEFMPGITLRDLLLGSESYDIKAIMYEVGATLAKIASHKFPKAGFFDKDLNIISEHAQDVYLHFVQKSLENQIVLKQLNYDTIAKINFCLKAYEFPNENERGLVHADFDPANILVNKIDGNWKIAAILDWEFSFSGSTLCDVANMLRYKHKMPAEFEESFLKGLKKGGVTLPQNWITIVHMLNLLSLIDCLVRSDSKNRPNQLTDIKNLIDHVLNELDSMHFIEVVPYNPAWPLEFEKEAKKIKEALGNDLVEVHHVGSTSVPGLMAKPKLDIIAVVKSLDNVTLGFESIGYQYRKEHEMPFRLYFTKKTEPNVNLHVFEENNPEIELNLLFRNFLRNSLEACSEYANLKQNLLTNKSAHEKNNSRSTGYNLGKNDFIKKIINQTGFAGLCFRPCQHYQEWQDYHRIRREQIFEPLNIIYDENHPTITANNHFHFVLYKGTEIVTVAHIEFLNNKEVAIRSLATDEPYKMQGHAKHIMQLLEKWIKQQGMEVIKLHANPDAEQFYRKLGYDNIEFDDVSISKDTIDLGKRL